MQGEEPKPRMTQNSSSFFGMVKILLDRFIQLYNGIQGWVDCFKKVTLKGIVKGAGMRDALNHKDVLNWAYDLGKKL